MPIDVLLLYDSVGFGRGYATEEIDINLEPLPIPTTSMPAYEYTLNTLLDGERRLVLDLVQRVQCEYLETESQVLAERLKDSTWQEVLTKIQEDALGCYRDDACRERWRAAIRSEAGTDSRGATMRRAKDQLADGNLWCERVLQGLTRLQPHLGDYHSCLWVIRVLLVHLKKSYTNTVKQGLVGPELIEELASKAHQMMLKYMPWVVIAAAEELIEITIVKQRSKNQLAREQQLAYDESQGRESERAYGGSPHSSPPPEPVPNLVRKNRRLRPPRIFKKGSCTVMEIGSGSAVGRLSLRQQHIYGAGFHKRV